MQRNQYITLIAQQFRIHTVCAILGPRQVGKTTLAHAFAQTLKDATAVHAFDLENTLDLARLDNP
ncbi:MAG: AAA family ATPase, partial [bacterium]